MKSYCDKCGHKHQGLRCGYPLKWASNNIPKEICLCEGSSDNQNRERNEN